MAVTSFRDIISNKYNLAPSQLKIVAIPNKRTVLIRDLLDRSLKPSDNGNEIGSVNYITKSSHYFIRAKALQPESFLPFWNKETVIPIRPQVLKSYDLSEGDIILSKDSNIGETVILDQNYSNYTISGALYKLPITQKKYYLLAFLKHSYFREQLDMLVPKGATIRHAKTLFLDCKIPLPNQKNSDDVIKYVELLTKVIINKEKEIRRKNQLVFELIENELLKNQKNKKFRHEQPTYNDLKENSRIDPGYYSIDYKQNQFLIRNYKNEAKPIKKWHYRIKRGQNLQVSCIGQSVYSDTPKENFYSLVRPTNFSEFGTVEKFEYLGNAKQLTTLAAGDIVFSAEGTIGKCVLFINPKDNWITNIHGIVLKKEDHNISESAFVSCFLRFLSHWRVFDYLSVGGQGGSLAMKYWKDIYVPNFPKEKQKEITKLYYNPIDRSKSLNLRNFLEEDHKWNKRAGIIELDKSAKELKTLLNNVLDKIINDEESKLNFL